MLFSSVKSQAPEDAISVSIFLRVKNKRTIEGKEKWHTLNP
jgi:hypothetical protein